jgi:hypothetical protein
MGPPRVVVIHAGNAADQDLPAQSGHGLDHHTVAGTGLS